MLLSSLDYNLHDGTDYFKQFHATASNHLLCLSPLQVAFDFLHILCALLSQYLLWFSDWYITAELTIKHLDSSSCCNGNILWRFKNIRASAETWQHGVALSHALCVLELYENQIFFSSQTWASWQNVCTFWLKTIIMILFANATVALPDNETLILLYVWSSAAASVSVQAHSY